MDELEKLKMLLHHWMEHNKEHTQLYRDWSEKVLSLGNFELSKTIDRLYHETMSLNRLFEEAIKKI